MTKQIDDGGPAFPNPGGDGSPLYADYGMSLRDWFAGQALMGLAAHYGTPQHNSSVPAQIAYELADAMIARRAALVAQEAAE